MLSLIAAAGRVARCSALPIFLFLTPLAAGCSAASSSEDSAVAPVPAGEGAAFARGVLGLPKSALPTSASLRARRYEATVTHLVAIVERKYPGQLDTNVAGLQSKDDTRIAASRDWLDGAFTAVMNSNDMASALRSDPLFSGVSIKSDGSGLSLENTNDGSSSGGSGSKDPNDVGKGANGKYGDDRTGLSGALADANDEQPGLRDRLNNLIDIDNGDLTPNPDSRLGAYAATAGYDPGTVGNAVHNAIGTIYGSLGTFGEENIGRVFNSSEAKALYDQPVDSDAGLQMATIEHQYWNNVRQEDPLSPGGNLGSAFSPKARDFLQKNVF